ncbi:hypothetical protein SK128_012418, partial [Halocaridina rubra]
MRKNWSVPLLLLLQLAVITSPFLPVYAGIGTHEGVAKESCHYCPYFISARTHVTAPQGSPANLTCGVRNLMDRKVSWIRRKDLHVLTTGNLLYTTNEKFRVLHLAGSPYWTLEMVSPTLDDAGVYECQVSTQPKIYQRFYLNVT